MQNVCVCVYVHVSVYFQYASDHSKVCAVGVETHGKWELGQTVIP